MQYLYKYLNIGKGSVVSFVGGGGKTSSIFTLAHELKDKGLKIAVTTTTHMMIPTSNECDITLINSTLNDVITASKSNKVVALGSLNSNNKFSSPDENIIDNLKHIFDVVLIEADGARQCPIKVPNSYEPVIHKDSNIFVAVVGIDCFNKSIKDIAHRPNNVANFLHTDVNHVLTLNDISTIVTSGNGLMKSSANIKNRFVIINKADTENDINNACCMSEFINNDGIPVIITSLKSSSNKIKKFMGV